MSKIVYTNSDGTIAIIHPIGSIANGLKAIPAGISTYTVVEDSIIPSDRTFRSSWVQVGIGTTATVTEDMTKAREIHKTNIREARVDKLAALDIEYQRATETSADTSAIVTKKQALRDAPAASGIATASNTTELKAQWDTGILGASPYS
tara:strand:- start:55 stop:501 length:447 start_codon:yes stop_codon:yes gene_type:complete